MIHSGNKLTLWIIASVFALFGVTAQAGPVTLMGIDAEDGNVAFGWHGGLQPYEAVVNSLLGDVTNSGSGLLVIGGGKDLTDDVTTFWSSMALTEAVSYVNNIDISIQDFSGFAAIAVVSDVHNTPSGGLTNDENNALTARSAEVASFVNSGGGLFGLSSEQVDVPYGYVAGLGSFTTTANPAYHDVTATAEGLLSGITDTNLDVDAWHNTYLTFPSFLSVLATVEPCTLAGFSTCDGIVGNAAAIGGVSVTIVPTVPEPSIIALFGLGLLGLGFARRRKA